MRAGHTLKSHDAQTFFPIVCEFVSIVDQLAPDVIELIIIIFIK